MYLLLLELFQSVTEHLFCLLPLTIHYFRCEQGLVMPVYDPKKTSRGTCVSKTQV